MDQIANKQESCCCWQIKKISNVANRIHSQFKLFMWLLAFTLIWEVGVPFTKKQLLSTTDQGNISKAPLWHDLKNTTVDEVVGGIWWDDNLSFNMVRMISRLSWLAHANPRGWLARRSSIKWTQMMKTRNLKQSPVNGAMWLSAMAMISIGLQKSKHTMAYGTWTDPKKGGGNGGGSRGFQHRTCNKQDCI